MYSINPEAERKQILSMYHKLLSAWWKKGSQEDLRMIRKALNLALDAHKDMRRKSGEPYIYHPLSVAMICVSEIGLGTTAVICALLHDVVEDTDTQLDEIERIFGPRVAKIVDGLTKIKGIFDKNTPSQQAESFKKLLLTLSDDVRVILIKIADRLHNMRTLDAMPQVKQLKIASETKTLFSPLAHRLGLYTIKSELEDLALKYIDPEVYNNISEKILETEEERLQFINEFIHPIKKALSKDGLNYEIISRTKSAASIFNKMTAKNIPFEEVYDLFAVRIIFNVPVDEERRVCWRIFALISEIYKVNHERTRDWLVTPKANGYEALHLTVMSHSGKWVEIQIRSRRMNEIAEKGYAAHWKYKEAEASQESGLDEWLNKIREVLQDPESDALKFLDDIKLTLYAQEIMVFTPKGESKTLPVHSSVLDFAYNIHSELGNQCIGAKVNYKLEPVNYILRSGDQVEIITSKKQYPKEEWLNYVVTARAQSKIRDYLREERKTYTAEGQVKLEHYFNQLSIPYTHDNRRVVRHALGLNSSTDLYYFVAIGKYTLKDIQDSFKKPDKVSAFSFLKFPFFKSKSHEEKTEALVDFVKSKANELLIGDKINNIKYSVSDCCKPIPGDMVIGIITDTEGIKVHRINCPQAIAEMSVHGNRMIKAKWKENENVSFLTGIHISGNDYKGLINRISEMISLEHKINIRSFHLDTDNGKFTGTIMIYVQDAANLDNLIRNLKTLRAIDKVYRIDSASMHEEN